MKIRIERQDILPETFWDAKNNPLANAIRRQLPYSHPIVGGAGVFITMYGERRRYTFKRKKYSKKVHLVRWGIKPYYKIKLTKT